MAYLLMNEGFLKNLTSGSRYVAVSEEHRKNDFLISKRIQSTRSMTVRGAIQDWYDKFWSNLFGKKHDNLPQGCHFYTWQSSPIQISKELYDYLNKVDVVIYLVEGNKNLSSNSKIYETKSAFYYINSHITKMVKERR